MTEEEQTRDNHGRFQSGHKAIPRRNIHGQFTRNETMVPLEPVPIPQPPEAIPETVTNDTTSRTVLTEQPTVIDPNLSPVITETDVLGCVNDVFEALRL